MSREKTTRRKGSGPEKRKGSLVVVGTGIMAAAHCSQEAISAIRNADVVLTTVPDPLALNWIASLNANLIQQDDLYHSCDNRLDTYHAMSDRIMAAVRAGQKVCAIFYGHPGVFVLPSYFALEQARAEGYPAIMQPGISAADCLFADLEVDPSHPGCQMYEASAFLFWEYPVTPRAALILWQIGVVGDHTFTLRAPTEHGLQALTDTLLEQYPADHQVCVYEASLNPVVSPRRDWMALADLPGADVNGWSTLYIPPYGLAKPNRRGLKRLGLTPADIADLE